jgi:heme/copper-type cytochrome/quinol oxidase subunit 3
MYIMNEITIFGCLFGLHFVCRILTPQLEPRFQSPLSWHHHNLVTVAALNGRKRLFKFGELEFVRDDRREIPLLYGLTVTTSPRWIVSSACTTRGINSLSVPNRLLGACNKTMVMSKVLIFC